VAALDSGQGLFRALVGFHGCLRDQARAVAIDAAHDRALVTLEQHAAIVSKLAPFLQLLGPRRRLAFIPGQFERRESFALGELIDHHRLVGMDFGIAADDARTLDRGGSAHFQGREDAIQGVGAAVAHHAAAEIPPAPPHHRVVAAVIGTLGGGPEPQVPIETCRHRHALLGTVAQRRTPPTVAVRRIGKPAPGIDLAHRADGAGPDPLADQAQAFRGMPLNTHLGDHARLLGRLGQHARLVDVMGQRLLAEDMLAGLHRRHRDHRVSVVGRGDEHRVDVLLFFQHDTVVLVNRCLRVGLE